MPAVHGTIVSDVPKHPVGVAVGQPRRDDEAFFPQGIFEVPWTALQLLRARYRLASDRAVGIGGIHERGVVRSHRHAETVRRGSERLAFRR